MTALFLGADGGQTKSIAVLVDEQGVLLGVGRAGPCNHFHEPGGPERYRNALQGMTLGAFENAQIDPRQGVTATCYGLTGNWVLARGVVEEFLSFQKFLACEDILTAHAGALANQPGIVVIGGTGAVAFGKDPAGKEARAGGLGYLLSDEGAGWDIGQRALHAAVRGMDGRGPETLLSAFLLEHFQLPNFEQIAQRIYADPNFRVTIAHLTPLVVQAAGAKDPVAREICASAGRELAICCAAAASQLNWADPPVSPTGGIFRSGTLLLEPFKEELQRLLPDSVLIPARYPPVLGAALLAFQTAGVPMTEEVLHNLDRGLHRLDF